MELERLTPTVQEAGELLGISRALADGDKLREELIALTRKAGISKPWWLPRKDSRQQN
jgi:hypothetical protein